MENLYDQYSHAQIKAMADERDMSVEEYIHFHRQKQEANALNLLDNPEIKKAREVTEASEARLHKLEQEASARVNEWRVLNQTYKDLQTEQQHQAYLLEQFEAICSTRLEAVTQNCLAGKSHLPYYNQPAGILELLVQDTHANRAIELLKPLIAAMPGRISEAGAKLKAFAKQHKLTNQLPAELR